MRTSTKLGLLGIGLTVLVEVVVGAIEIIDYRKGKRRIHAKDAELIAETIVKKQEDLKKAKKDQKNQDKKE